MNLDNYSFHDAQILEVKEICGSQRLELILDFPVDWNNELFEHKMLWFEGVTKYLIEEIPFAGIVTILQVDVERKLIPDFFVADPEISKYEILITTNAGSRKIECDDCELD